MTLWRATLAALLNASPSQHPKAGSVFSNSTLAVETKTAALKQHQVGTGRGVWGGGQNAVDPESTEADVWINYIFCSAAQNN